MKTLSTLLALAALPLFFSCGGGKPQTNLLKSVEVTHPRRVESQRLKSFSGIVEEAQEISLGFKTPGQIEEICVKEGDCVEKGQLIARLDDSDYKLAVEATEIQYNQLKSEVARMKKLYENKSLSGNDYEKAEAGLAQVGVQLQVNRNKLDYTRLYSPVQGYIQSVNFEEAEMVDAGTPIATLLDTHRMEVAVDIPASLYTQREQIGKIYCRSTFSPEDDMGMSLESITLKADGNQLYKMRLAFDSRPDGDVTPGMNVEVVIALDNGATVGECTLPLHAIFQEGGESYVWVVGGDSTVSRRAIAVKGVDNEGNAILLSDLDEEEEIVKAGVNVLHDNDKVRIIGQPSDSNVGGLL